MKFAIVDAFTDAVFGGNPAGVVMVPDGGDFPDAETMRKTAAELRYSETAFIKDLGDGRFQIRYFTPAAEVDLCGHATIASFHTLLKNGKAVPGQTCIAETLAGTLEILVEEDRILMEMGDPQILGTIEKPEELEKLYQVMGLSAEDQGMIAAGSDGMTDPLLPKLVSTGLPDIMLPVRDEAQLEQMAPDFAALTELSRQYDVVGVHAFTVNTEDGMIHARNFAPLYEIDEEAATGTANGALSFYLYDYGLLQPEQINTVIQGEKMDRPSKISTQILLHDGKAGIKVGGAAATLAEGEIYL